MQFRSWVQNAVRFRSKVASGFEWGSSPSRYAYPQAAGDCLNEGAGSLENISILHTVQLKKIKGLRQPWGWSGLELYVFRFSSRKTSDIRNISKSSPGFAAPPPTLFPYAGFAANSSKETTCVIAVWGRSQRGGDGRLRRVRALESNQHQNSKSIIIIK